jgi:hypothetical protein
MERKEYPVTDVRCSTVVAGDMENRVNGNVAMLSHCTGYMK